MNSNLGQLLFQTDLPFIPLPPTYRQLIQTGLENRFSSHSIRNEYEFTAHNKSGRLKVNYAAFTSDTHYDLDTAAVAIYYEPSGTISEEFILDQLALCGAPFVFVGRKEDIHPFGMNANGKPTPYSLREPLSYNELGEFFGQYQADINPEKINAAKRGIAQFVAFPQLNPLQLRLFTVDITRKLLAESFSNAVQLLRENFKAGRKGLSPLDEIKVTEIAVQLLGAIILAHKGRLGAEYQATNASFSSVLTQAASMFPNYFNQELLEKHWLAAKSAYRFLQQATYSSFTPDMLGELYHRAYPSVEKRKKEGRFDTPLYLTRLILDNIPIEYIRPEDRLLADITCGWGSFLVAGYERLTQMPDMNDSPLPLQEQIIGNDFEQLTAHLAKLALLTTSLSDDWQVTNQDALELQLNDRQPTIIVGNPKFYGDRKLGERSTETDTATGESKRLQEADAFLRKAIDLLTPGGYLGMLMPKSFSISEASTETRKILLERCDVFEIWDLPDETFRGQAKVSSIVLFAKKRAEVGRILSYPVRVRSGQGRSLEQVGIFNASTIASSQNKWGEQSVKAKRSTEARVTHLITYTTVLSEQKWAEISDHCRELVDVAKIISGATPGSKPRWRWADYPGPKWVPWLSGVKKSMPYPFYINYGSEKILYPNELEEPRKNKRYPEKDNEYLLAAPKVLLVSDPNPSWGKRAKVAIERRGYYPSNHFWVIAPKTPEISLEVLAAVISWDVSNAWIIDSLRYPWVRRQVLDSIPFPHLSTEDCQRLEKAVRNIEAAAQNLEQDKEAQQELDEVLKEAYRLDEQTFKTLRMVMEWDTHPEIKRPVAPAPQTTLQVSGQVAGRINMTAHTMDLWFDGIPGTHNVPIVDAMPGWMLREGAGFEAEVSYQALLEHDWVELSWWNIRPKKYTYMTEKELIERLTHELEPELE
jgi:hypothetical protein